MQELNKHVSDVNSLLARYGVRFGIYKNNTFKCEGILPSKSIYSHISGIDLVQGKDKKWYKCHFNTRKI